MKEKERSTLVQKILSEFHYYCIDSSLSWSKSCRKICHRKGIKKRNRFEFLLRVPCPEILYRANIIYEDTIDHFRWNDYLKESTIVNSWLKKHEVECEETRNARKDDDLDIVYYWTDEMDKTMEELSNKIDAFKVKLYYNSDAPTKQIDEIRTELKKVQAVYSDLYTRKHTFDYLTAEHIANKLQARYICENTIYDVNKRPIKGLPHHFIDNIIAFVRNEAFSATDLREIAHTSPWLQHYKTAQSNPFNKFHLSNDILQLMSLTRWYEMIRELPYSVKEGEVGRPSDKVIDDDDMLDGWYILWEKQRPTHEKLLIESSKFNPETFIMSKTQEEANEIWNRNSNISKGILQNRAEQLRGKQIGLGTKNQDLNDVRLEINLGLNKLAANRRIGK